MLGGALQAPSGQSERSPGAALPLSVAPALTGLCWGSQCHIRGPSAMCGCSPALEASRAGAHRAPPRRPSSEREALGLREPTPTPTPPPGSLRPSTVPPGPGCVGPVPLRPRGRSPVPQYRPGARGARLSRSARRWEGGSGAGGAERCGAHCCCCSPLSPPQASGRGHGRPGPAALCRRHPAAVRHPGPPLVSRMGRAPRCRRCCSERVSE